MHEQVCLPAVVWSCIMIKFSHFIIKIWNALGFLVYLNQLHVRLHVLDTQLLKCGSYFQFC